MAKAKVISVANQKGGVGKSIPRYATSASYFCLADTPLKVCPYDFDFLF